MPFNPTDGQKRNALYHVFYEIEQLFHASSLQTDDATINNALLESVLMHTRALLDFFEKQQRYQDDVLVLDYGFDASPIGISQADRTRVNKDVAHLTYSRLDRTPETKRWDFNIVVTPILVRAQEFIEHLRSNYVNPGDHEVLADCNKVLAKLNQRLA